MLRQVESVVQNGPITKNVLPVTTLIFFEIISYTFPLLFLVSMSSLSGGYTIWCTEEVSTLKLNMRELD